MNKQEEKLIEELKSYNKVLLEQSRKQRKEIEKLESKIADIKQIKWDVIRRNWSTDDDGVPDDDAEFFTYEYIFEEFNKEDEE